MDSKTVNINASKYDTAMHVFFKKHKISHIKYKQKHIDLFDLKNGLKWIDRPYEQTYDDHYEFEIINSKKYLLAKIKYGF